MFLHQMLLLNKRPGDVDADMRFHQDAFCILLLFKCSIYILDMIKFSDMGFANVFLQPVSSLSFS